MLRLKMVLAFVLVALIVASPSLAISNGGGNSSNAPGQVTAKANCDAAITAQITGGVQAGGGPKSAESGPLNCDHYWQSTGAIGNS